MVQMFFFVLFMPENKYKSGNNAFESIYTILACI